MARDREIEWFRVRGEHDLERLQNKLKSLYHYNTWSEDHQDKKGNHISLIGYDWKPDSDLGGRMSVITIPKIGEPFEGGIFAGIARGKPDYYLIVGPEYDGELTWDEAMKWAGELNVDGQEFGLPTRKEQALMFANVPELFKSEWYWSNAQHAEYTGYAWLQDFGNGYQYVSHKSVSYRVRAVRRLPI